LRMAFNLEKRRKYILISVPCSLAGGVFLQNQKTESPHPQNMANLEFLIAAMKALSKRHPITEHFVAQLELDIGASGIAKSTISGDLKHGFPKAVSTPFSFSGEAVSIMFSVLRLKDVPLRNV
jgi:hypothetical protein